MIVLNKLKEFLSILLDPRCWIRNYRTCDYWDDTLNELMKEHKFRKHKFLKYTAYLGNIEIWISNHPYASFTLYNNAGVRGMPRRSTVFKAMKKLNKDFIDAEKAS